MLEPAHVGGAALVALGAQPRRRLGVEGHDHPPLPRRHLLVGVEGEGREVAARADPATLGVDGAERLAGVLEDRRARRRRGQRLELRHRRRVAEDVDRQEPGGALPGGRLGRRRVEVERDRVDVAEDRPRALVEEAVGGGDEAEAGWSGPRRPGPSRAPARRGAAPSCRWRRRPRRRPRASPRSRARSARPSGPARAGPSAAPRAPAPPRARRSRACASGIGSFVGAAIGRPAYFALSPSRG